jgi:hypothetical protein
MPRKKVIKEVNDRMNEVARQLDSIYTALVIRDPGTAVSSEAFEGLRRQIIAGAQERMAHLVQLAEIDVAISAGADADTLSRMVHSWLSQAAVELIHTPTDDLRFEQVAGDGPWEIASPAYIDSATGRTIRQGRLRQVPVANDAATVVAPVDTEVVETAEVVKNSESDVEGES